MALIVFCFLLSACTLEPERNPSATPVATQVIANVVSVTPIAMATPTAQPILTPTIVSIATNRPTDQPTTRPTTQLPSYPISQPTPVPTQASASNNVTLRETTLTILTYDYTRAFVATTADDPIYPYPHLDFNKVGATSQPVAYRAVVLENRYVALTFLPELGGRLYRWVDKTTGRDLLYHNPVIKPTHWGYRGWWLAAGGTEWALPVEEHGLNEYRPWTMRVERSADSITISMSDTESRTGLNAQIDITLDGEHNYLTLMPRLFNPTAKPLSYQFWLNAMLAPSGNNHVSPQTEFIWPSGGVMVHSTGDKRMPTEKQTFNWPSVSDVDLRFYRNWRDWLGLFESPQARGGYVGVYDHTSDAGVVRVFPPDVARGVKIFGAPGLVPSLWTDDDSTYIELWGGATPTFWDYATLPPQGAISWTERWYAVHGTDGFDVANEHAALKISMQGDQARVSVATTHLITGQIVLWEGGKVSARWPTTISPERPFTQQQKRGSGALGLQLLNSDGAVLAQMGEVGQ